MKPEAIYRLKIPIRDCLGSVLPGLDNFPSIGSPNSRPLPGRPATNRRSPAMWSAMRLLPSKEALCYAPPAGFYIRF
jgi:hypothetical protein